MLMDVAILLGVYTGARFVESYIKKNTQKSPSLFLQRNHSKPPPFIVNTIGQEQAKSVMPIEAAKNFQDSRVFNEDEKKYTSLLKVSSVNLVLSTVRQFIYPPIAPLYLGLVSYTSYMLFKGAEKSLMGKRVGTDVFSSVFTLMGIGMNQYFALAFGNWIYIWGCKIVAQTQNASQKSFMDLFELPSKVWVQKDGIEVEIPLERIQLDDIVIVRAGDIIPIDGVIIKGMAMVDQHALTGEAQPAEKEIGDIVLASTVVLSGEIHAKVEKSGAETTLVKINQLLTDAALFKTQMQLSSEELANKVALPFMTVALLTSAFLGAPAGLVVLSSNFGNRFRVLAPLGTLNYLKLSFQKGNLIKDGRAIEVLNQIDTVLFDKTGILTEEIPEVKEIILCDHYEKDEVLTYAAAAERKVAHPIAKAILNKAEEYELTLPDIEDAEYQIGFGIIVSLDKQIIRVGSARFMSAEGFILPDKIEKAMTHSHTQGHSLVIVTVNQKVIGAIELQTVVRPEVKEVMSGLRKRGIKHISIVSGDHKLPTQKWAESLGMDSYFYDTLPSGKSNIVEQLQKEGKYVCFIGDGINDAVAMKRANVSISITGSTSIAMDVADVILMDGTLSHLCDLFDISRELNEHLKNSFYITVIPTAINMVGVFFFNLGFMTAFTMKNMLFLGGVGHAMFPLRRFDNKSSIENET